MRILHTADWHIGQTLNGWTREHEHRAFLANLRDLIADERIDALLVAGDVFDAINPSGDAQRLLYESIASFHSAKLTDGAAAMQLRQIVKAEFHLLSAFFRPGSK